MCDCLVCSRIEQIRRGENPYFVEELSTGYVVLGDYQRFPGYTLFLCKEHASELHHLDREFRNRFLDEMSLTAEAVYRAFQPEKLNYELLGKGNAVHMHWHLFPRKTGDVPGGGPVWRLPSEEMYDEKYRPTTEELENRKRKLRTELHRLMREAGILNAR